MLNVEYLAVPPQGIVLKDMLTWVNKGVPLKCTLHGCAEAISNDPKTES